ncbi:hypothetical protein CDD81_2631 [Ophiocordyceps australis]|uniref:Uncharacterized protein n=1 Tax=Ophiocordyceps australis TaxID=1399860 RepID=A0A2C5XWE8_9HYPO|nr:hypothetical protein CDD81_2631 [Ophiocordyceps australis]
MTREGTRSQTGHSRPRVFLVPDTAPVQKRRREGTKAGVRKKRSKKAKTNKADVVATKTAKTAAKMTRVRLD